MTDGHEVEGSLDLPAYAFEDLEPLPPEAGPALRRAPDDHSIPDQLRTFAAIVKRIGHADTTPGRMMGWFGARNRSARTMSLVERALSEVGLATGPALSSQGRGDRIRFFADGREPALVIPSHRLDERGLLLREAPDVWPDEIEQEAVTTAEPSHLHEGEAHGPDAQDDWQLRERSAQQVRTSKRTLTALAEDPVCAVREAVARNRNTPADVLVRLAEHHPSAVASNPSAPATLLAALAQHRRWAVQMALAHNQATPAEILQRMIGTADIRLRINLAGNVGLPESDRLDLLETLLERGNRFVRLWIAWAPSTPRPVLARLTADAHRDVRQLATKRLEKLDRARVREAT